MPNIAAYNSSSRIENILPENTCENPVTHYKAGIPAFFLLFPTVISRATRSTFRQRRLRNSPDLSPVYSESWNAG